MHDENTVRRFVELRATGWTYGKLTTELNVTKPTLIAWSRKHQFEIQNLRACLKIPRGAVFAEKAEWRGATKENTLRGSSTEEQRSQTALCTKTLRAVGLLSLAGVGSVVTARCGDAPPSPPWPKPKSLAAAPLVIFRQALRLRALNLKL